MDTETEDTTWAWIGWGVTAFLAALIIIAVLFRWL